jgi:uncharacterized protein
MNALEIDAFEFCRLNESRAGEIPIADLARLAEESVTRSGVIRWSLNGGINMHGHPQLKLAVSGSVQLMCQRCLAPFEFQLASDAVLILAKDEAGADQIEALIDDEDIDVVAVSKLLDIAGLVEDEALLMMPLAPKHEECPQPALSKNPQSTNKDSSPFEVLKNWKQ